MKTDTPIKEGKKRITQTNRLKQLDDCSIWFLKLRKKKRTITTNSNLKQKKGNKT